MTEEKFQHWLLRAALFVVVLFSTAQSAFAGRFVDSPSQDSNRQVRSSSSAGHFGNPDYSGYNANPYEAQYMAYVKAESNYRKQLAQYNYKIRLMRQKQNEQERVVREKRSQQMMARWEKEYQLRLEAQRQQPQPSSIRWTGNEEASAGKTVAGRRAATDGGRTYSSAPGAQKPSIWERLKAAFAGRIR